MLRPVCFLIILVAAAAVALSVPAASSASSAPALPPASQVAPPDNPTGPPEAESRGVELLNPRLKGRTVTLELACEYSGRVELFRVGQNGKRLGSSKFVCKESRAKATVKISSRIAKKAKNRKALNGLAKVVTEAERTQLPVRIRLASHSLRALASSGRAIPPAWCVPPRFHMSVDTSTSFGANIGDVVYWQPVALKYRNGSYSWAVGAWDSYRVHPEDGQIVWNGDGTIWIPGPSSHRTGNVYVGGSARAWPAIQSWTPQHGYQLRYIQAAIPYGYGEYYTDYCDFPAL
jgi:hypothetical protein